MISSGRIPIWLPMATSCYLDIRHILQESVGDAFQQAQTTLKDAQSTLGEYLQFQKTLEDPNYRSGKASSHSEFKTNIAWWYGFSHSKMNFMLGDHGQKTLKLPRSENLGLPPPTEHLVYKQQPVLCGLVAYRIALEFRHFGLGLNSGWGTIGKSAHLYNALRQEANPIKACPLMEEALSIHSEIFVGPRPQTIDDCFKHAYLMGGASLSNLAKNRRNIKLVTAKKGVRAIVDTCPMGKIFWTYWYDKTREKCEKAQSMDDAFLRSEIGNFGIFNPEATIETLIIYKVEKYPNDQAKDKELAANPVKTAQIRRGWLTTKRLTSLQLLQALRNTHHA